MIQFEVDPRTRYPESTRDVKGRGRCAQCGTPLGGKEVEVFGLFDGEHSMDREPPTEPQDREAWDAGVRRVFVTEGKAIQAKGRLYCSQACAHEGCWPTADWVPLPSESWVERVKARWAKSGIRPQAEIRATAELARMDAERVLKAGQATQDPEAGPRRPWKAQVRAEARTDGTRSWTEYVGLDGLTKASIAHPRRASKVSW